MKKLKLFAVLTVCALLLTGCANEPQKPENTKQPTSTEQPESSALDLLRSNVVENDCMLGVGFFGYIDSESDEKYVRDYIANSELANSYPFLIDCTPVLSEGEELFAFVPANDDTAITVYRADITEDGEYIENKDTPICAGKPGETIVLRCNISEVFSNALISVSDGKSIKEFLPMISLKDGHMVNEPGCYDFSIYS